ncbi:MAG TPA: hypothetical protein VGB37_15440 [Candidatus Lokiarchaeia archaeon]
MKFYGIKIIKCITADIHCHYANNRGRGRNNLTLTVVKKGTVRKIFTRDYLPEELISQWRTASWRGNFNISNSTLKTWGGIE